MAIAAPRLVVVIGPLAGTTWELVEGATPIGRQEDNRVVLGDPAVSRHHCRIERGASGLRLVDLSSRSGTFVNGLPVTERILEPGDRIVLGTTELTVRGAAEPSQPSLQLADSELHAATTVERPLDQLNAPGASGGTPVELGALLDLIGALGTSADPEAIARKLLARAMDVVPAERGAVLRVDRGDGSATVLAASERDAADTVTRAVSRTLVQRVAATRSALLCRDAVQDESVAGVASVESQRIRALLALPIASASRIEGVLYLDTRSGEPAFSERHLEIAGALAAVAGAALEGATRVAALESEKRALELELRGDRRLVGESAPMRDLYSRIERVARTDSTVLLRGESGTGKELVARAVHDNSRRAARPFVAINCAAVAETLLESELFGHERGAFTGAVGRREGRFESADGGTLFLDEVAELSPALQAKLLRVLQERTLERVGGTRPVAIDVRVVAATHQDLEARIKDGRFREDLYYRLNVVALRLPALRERREDIPLLARHFVAHLAARLDRPEPRLGDAALARLAHYSWPGNVRELENAIERALVLGADDELRPEDLPEALLESPSPPLDAAAPSPGFHDQVNAAKREIILAAIAASRGSITEAARRLGLHPNYLHRLLNNLELRDQIG